MYALLRIQKLVRFPCQEHGRKKALSATGASESLHPKESDKERYARCDPNRENHQKRMSKDARGLTCNQQQQKASNPSCEKADSASQIVFPLRG
jgi:hypothetical protein